MKFIYLLHLGYGFLQLDGSVPMAARMFPFSPPFFSVTLLELDLGMPMIDEFHENPDIFIFLISTLAGGTGLNAVLFRLWYPSSQRPTIFDPQV